MLDHRIQDGRAHYVACHNETYVDNKFDVVRFIRRGGTFFLNTKIAALPRDRLIKALEAKISPKILRKSASCKKPVSLLLGKRAEMSFFCIGTLALRKVNFYIMDAASLATKFGLKGVSLQPQFSSFVMRPNPASNRHCLSCQGKINMICMSAFFRLSGVLPIDEAINLLKESVTKAYSYKGEDVVRKNHELLDGKRLLKGAF